MDDEFPTGEDAYLKALRAAEDGDHEHAIELFGQVELEGDNNAALGRGNSLVAIGRMEEAVLAFRKAAEGGVPEAWLNLGLVLHRLRRKKAARTAFEKASDLGDIKGAAGLALLAWYSGDYGEAERISEHGARMDDEFSLAIYSAARWRITRDASLRNDLEQHAELFDGASIALSELLISQGETDAAVAVLERAASLELSDCYLPLGNLYHDLGQMAAAKQAFLSGIDHGDRNSHYNLALLLFEEGEKREAVRHLKHAARAGDDLSRRKLKEIRRKHLY